MQRHLVDVEVPGCDLSGGCCEFVDGGGEPPGHDDTGHDREHHGDGSGGKPTQRGGGVGGGLRVRVGTKIGRGGDRDLCDQ
ncbi:MAG: hypothetical protein WD225_05145 [Ilumatobacteraceae bacterium]